MQLYIQTPLGVAMFGVTKHQNSFFIYRLIRLPFNICHRIFGKTSFALTITIDFWRIYYSITLYGKEKIHKC